MTYLPRFVALAVLCFLNACSGGDSGTAIPVSSPPPTPVPAAEVAATTALAFDPPTVTIVQGGTVTFDFQSVAHNVFFDATAGAPQSITQPTSNTSVTLTFATAGTFGYACHIHPYMHGTVTVVAAK